MTIPLTDLGLQYESIKDEVNSAISQVITESNFILGRHLNLLEEEVAKYFGVKSAVGVASGTDALVLSLAALGIGRQDEVITTPFTFIATAEAIVRVGAKPVFCDIDYKTYNIDTNKIEQKITPKTKAIIPVHLYGMPCEMGKIMSIAKEHGLKVIEDCAQSFGSEYQGKKTGAIGDCGCLSFFPSKTLGCFGDGGMVVTDNTELAGRLKLLRNHGSTNKYYYTTHGFNSRLDTLQAAVLRVKLKYIDKWIQMRIDNAGQYNSFLENVSVIVTPQVPAQSKHSFNYYTVRVKGGRQRVQESLMEKSVASAVYYPFSLHLQEVFRDLGHKRGDFPVAEEAQEQVLSLPMYPELKPEQIKEVAQILLEVFLPAKKAK
jgi:dTDP-4-amino-4,6-dideoxygalactose transaminase